MRLVHFTGKFDFVYPECIIRASPLGNQCDFVFSDVRHKTPVQGQLTNGLQALSHQFPPALALRILAEILASTPD